MTDTNMEEYISREEAMSAIQDYAERRYDSVKASPAWVAGQISALIGKLDVKRMKDGLHIAGEIRNDFKGHFFSAGICSSCGMKLMWYTEHPIKRCPYCGMYRKKELPKFLSQKTQEEQTESN